MNNYKRFGDYIQLVNNRNSEWAITNLLGVNIYKNFMSSFAAANKAGFTKWKLNASTFLSTYFKDLNRIDGAYYYQGITIVAKDSLFSQEKMREVQKAIRFLGLLGLLLFEFISLFLLPYIATFTHHKPIFMLLILVAIASILIPMQHKLQGWVKEKLAQKTMNASTVSTEEG